MKKRYDDSWDALQAKVVGLGERSFRKSYYPKLQEKLSELERFKALLNLANDMIFLIHCPTRSLVDVSRSMCVGLGYTREELLDLKVYDVLPAEAVSVMADWHGGNRPDEEGSKTLITRLLVRNGSELPVEITLSHVTFNEVLYCVAVARDITERKRSEEKIARQNEFLKTILESIPNPFYVLDATDYTIKMANSAAAPAGLPLNATCFALTRGTGKPCDNPQHCCPIETIKRTRQSLTTEQILYDTKGNARHVEVHAHPIFDSDGEVVQIIEYVMDITERKAMEAALYRREQEYRALVENSPDIIVRVDREFRRVYVNQALEAVTGFPLSDFIGSTIYEPRIEGRLEYIALMEKACTKVFSTGEETAFEFPYPTTRGTRYFHMRLVPEYSKEGRIESVLTIGRDITDLTQVQEELRRARDELELRVQERTAELAGANQLSKNRAALLDLAHDAIFVRDLDDKVTFWNNGSIETYGFTKEEALGRVAKELLQTVCHEPLEKIMENVLREGRWEGELRNTTSKGKQIAVESRWAIQADGKPIGFLEIDRDITARKKAEEALKASMARLELINQELREFAFVASHDLQEPLRKIQTFSDLVQDRCAPLLGSCMGGEYLDRVVSSAGRMRQLLDDLLRYSRITSRPERFKTIDLARVVREVADLFEMDLKKSGGLIEIERMPELDADESQMLRLFQNLIGNALKFRSEESPRIKIHAKHDGGRCEVFVQDNGIGFEKRFAELIFRPFQRLHGRSEYEGTGMGLTICRKIVDRHGGSIRAESEPGKGSTFIISLPVKQERLEEDSDSQE